MEKVLRVRLLRGKRCRRVSCGGGGECGDEDHSPIRVGVNTSFSFVSCTIRML